MKILSEKEQLNGVSGFWNSDKVLKWDKKYDEYDTHTMRYLGSRQEKLFQLITGLNLPQGTCVLELGYGAGQTALKLGQLGFEVHGVDISEKLCEKAKERCQQLCPDGKFHLKTGSIESRMDYEDNSFDLVVLVGALQYLYNDNACINEVYRLLKPGGHFVLAQRSAYCFSQLTDVRLFFCFLSYLFLRKRYELFPSFKSILLDSRWGKIFKRYEKAKFLNVNWMVKGYDDWQYKLRKRIYTYWRIKKLLNSAGLRPKKALGAYYPFSENAKHFEFNVKFDRVIDRHLPNILFPLSRAIVVLSQKLTREHDND